MKIQLKMTLLFTLLCLSVVLLLSMAVYYFANEKAFQDFYTRLEFRAVIASKINFDVNQQSQETYEQLRKQHVQRLPEEEEFIIRTDTLDKIRNTPLYRTAGAAFFEDAQRDGKAIARHNFQFFAGITHSADQQQYLIIVTAVHSYAQNFLASLSKILIISSILSIIVLFSIGLLFSRQVLSPIRNIADRVNTISATSLHQRLELRKGKDELTLLADTFNDMLSRLETAFETQNNFVSNASHELNTPLTAIIGEADLSLARQRSPEQYRETLQVIMSEAEKLKSVTSGLLELAQSSFHGHLVYDEVNVDELVHNSIRVALNVYPGCPVRLDQSLRPSVHRELTIRGNAQLFELAISNVLLNACKYSGDKPVTLAVGISKTQVIFIITDQGIGIPAADMKYIFDPFFRASNVRNTRGYGIGLPLARNIVHLYKGAIEIHSKENTGTEVIIKFPL
ncbi:MAG TPA: HAMP domain-containing sensor histidine kinase [Puia sp.]|nr:HAMP domain-containing sensor histidine kinase [Puia sp.]